MISEIHPSYKLINKQHVLNPTERWTDDGHGDYRLSLELPLCKEYSGNNSNVELIEDKVVAVHVGDNLDFAIPLPQNSMFSDARLIDETLVLHAHRLCKDCTRYIL